MPQTKDKFKTIVDRGGSNRPGSVTVIRKDSDYSKEFDKQRSKVMKHYDEWEKEGKRPSKLRQDFPKTLNEINRNASSEIAADRTVGKIKYNAQVTPGKWTTKNN